MKKGKNTKSKITKKAFKLFQNHGIKRVSVEEICKKSNVSKATFYKYYKNKMDLALYIFEEILEKSKGIKDKIFESDLIFQQKIYKLLNFKFLISKKLGKHLLEEIFNNKSEISQLFINESIKSQNETIEFFKKGQEEGFINPNFSNEFLIHYSSFINDFIYSSEINKIFPDPMDRIKNITELFLFGICVPPEFETNIESDEILLEMQRFFEDE